MLNESELKEIIPSFRETIFNNYKDLERNLNEYAVLFEFNVDDRIKVACKQYLDYFVQFLQDLGIDSCSNTYEQINKILFEVVPKDKTIALSRIKECLILYLNLINNDEIEKVHCYDNIAFIQLKANIHHLKSQLMLAQATIREKELTINMVKDLVDEKHDNKNEKEVEILNGVVTVGSIDCKAFKFNLGQLIKILFRRK